GLQDVRRRRDRKVLDAALQLCGFHDQEVVAGPNLHAVRVLDAPGQAHLVADRDNRSRRGEDVDDRQRRLDRDARVALDRGTTRALNLEHVLGRLGRTDRALADRLDPANAGINGHNRRVVGTVDPPAQLGRLARGDGGRIHFKLGYRDGRNRDPGSQLLAASGVEQVERVVDIAGGGWTHRRGRARSYVELSLARHDVTLARGDRRSGEAVANPGQLDGITWEHARTR